MVSLLSIKALKLFSSSINKFKKILYTVTCNVTCTATYAATALVQVWDRGMPRSGYIKNAGQTVHCGHRPALSMPRQKGDTALLLNFCIMRISATLVVLQLSQCLHEKVWRLCHRLFARLATYCSINSNQFCAVTCGWLIYNHTLSGLLTQTYDWVQNHVLKFNCQPWEHSVWTLSLRVAQLPQCPEEAQLATRS